MGAHAAYQFQQWLTTVHRCRNERHLLVPFRAEKRAPTRTLHSTQTHNHNIRSMRSSACILFLSVPRNNLSFGSRAFRVSVPIIRNTLPPSFVTASHSAAFRRHLKTHCFQSALPPPSDPATNAPIHRMTLTSL